VQAPIDFDDIMSTLHYSGVQAYRHGQHPPGRYRGHPPAVADPALDGVTGRYYNQQAEARAHPQAYDPAARTRLRELSENLTGLSR
jgi:hypothetical protein